MSRIKYHVIGCYCSGTWMKDSHAIPKDADDNRVVSSHTSVVKALHECHQLNDAMEKIGESDLRCFYVVADDGYCDHDPEEVAQLETELAAAREPQAEAAVV
jgi:hypothetical protein